MIRRLLALTLLLLLGGLALVPGVRWPVYGWLRGEAFYDGMPTSWWESEITNSYVARPCLHEYHMLWLYNPRSSWSEWLAWTGWTQPAAGLMRPPLLERDPAAIPVLVDLLRSKEARVRHLAAQGLMEYDADHDPALRVALPALCALLPEEPEPAVRLWVEEALLRLDPEAAAKAGVK